MLIGVLDTWRYQRRAFWEKFFLEVGAEVLKAQNDFATSLADGQNLMPKERLSVQLLIGRLMELIEAEVILIPELNPGCEPGPNDDPWTSDLAGVLHRRLSLPPLVRVPVDPSENEILTLAVEYGQNIAHNGQLVRRALMRTQPFLKPVRPSEPRWTVGGKKSIGLVASPILLEEPFLLKDVLTVLDKANLHPIFTNYQSIDWLIEHGKKVSNKIKLNTDREIAGMFSLCETKSAIKGIVFLSEPNSMRTESLIEELAEKSRKPNIILQIDAKNSIEEYTQQLIQWSKSLTHSL